MNENRRYQNVGGATAHVGDCHVWAEIAYLDSATDYREYLPVRQWNVAMETADLVLLGDIPCSHIKALAAATSIGVVICILLLVVIR